MNIEDEIDREYQEYLSIIEQKNQELEQNKQVIEQKDQALEEKDREIAELKRLLGNKG